VWTYAKNNSGAILQERERLTYTDDFGNEIDSTSIREFDLHGNLISEVDPDGNARKYVYDFYSYNHKPKSLTTYFYKGITSLASLNQTHASTPSEFQTLTEWDESGEVVRQETADEKTIVFVITRDEKGRVIGRVTTTTWIAEDGQNVRTTETETWDRHGNLTDHVLPNGDERTYIYRQFGSLIQAVEKVKFGELFFTTTTIFSENRSPSGLLLSQSQTIRSTDGFGNRFTAQIYREFDSFGNEIRSIDPNDTDFSDLEFLRRKAWWPKLLSDLT
jgi:hypothetical protein